MTDPAGRLSPERYPPPGRPVVFGEVLFDRFDDGSSVLGGAPFNVVWHLQGFGLDPLLISRVGRSSSPVARRKTMRLPGSNS